MTPQDSRRASDMSQPTTPSFVIRSGLSSPSPTQSSFNYFGQKESMIPSILEVPEAPKRKFKSARLTGEYEKPWLQTPSKRKRWDRYICLGGAGIGLIAGAALCFLQFMAVPNNQYCMIFEDQFDSLNTENWNFEIQRGGFGTGSFDWTTNDPTNAFTDSEGLHIVPTLTTETTNITVDQLLDNYILNLTTAGDCTSDNTYPTIITDCSIRSNKTSGDIINPVRSARLTTKGKKTMKYGRIEVEAKMPKGDWLWPAIWMMPEDSVYGAWPASGEIDIAESRGNDGDSYPDGRDSVGSTLHWGPIPSVDAFWKTSGKHNIRRTDYSEGFRTYGLEWSEKYLFTYIDNRLLQTFYFDFAKQSNMWNYGGFGQQIVNHSALFDPWSQTGQKNTPFDQEFYLILNVAVGSTNGYFGDKVASKPWGDDSLTAPAEFWKAKDMWYPTWGNGTDRGMTVKSVKMYSEGACK